MNFRTKVFSALAAFAALAMAPVGVAAKDWNLTQSASENGHKVGNPDAPVELVTYISYTCPGCALFEQQSEAGLRMLYVHEGKLSLEVRPFIRNPVDMAAALAAECGPEEKFFMNHRALVFSQSEWLPKMFAATPAQTVRWVSGTHTERMRAIARDLGFYQIMERRGFGAAALDQCLADEARGIYLETETLHARDVLGIPGTPSFMVNGAYVPDVHGWANLQPVLKATLDAATASQ